VQVGQGDRVVAAEVPLPQPVGPLQVGDGRPVLANAAVGVADRLQDLRLHQRLVGEPLLDPARGQFPGGAVQQFVDGRVLLRLGGGPAGQEQGVGLAARIGLAQEPDLEEVPHRLGDAHLLFGSGALGNFLPVGLLGQSPLAALVLFRDLRLP
jgi:hypothetical protein